MSSIQIPLATNSVLAQQVIENAIANGVLEFCLAPGSRNSPLVYALKASNQIKVYYWSEERSAAFFALGRAQATKRPVAVVITSGTAVAECLPAVMNAHYLGVPLLIIAADRPRRFRGKGAPQSAEQPQLFGSYIHYEQDLEAEDVCNLASWSCKGPGYLNVCFEEPREQECLTLQIKESIPIQLNWKPNPLLDKHIEDFLNFIQKTKYPFVIVGGLPTLYREEIVKFLLQLNAPVYAEGFSNIREDPRLYPIRITRMDNIWKIAERYQYPIDGVLRIGTLPTARLWRDLEENQAIQVCSISEQPFPGLSWASVIHTSIPDFCNGASSLLIKKHFLSDKWLKADKIFQTSLENLIKEEPLAEPSLIHSLSNKIYPWSHVFLGNSLPIREWDLAAIRMEKQLHINATRGVNGIDGQISNFLGLCQLHQENWALLGDLTVIYDMAGPWILQQMQNMKINLVVINNYGGQIFSRMYADPCFKNSHSFNFEHLAAFWQIPYEKWEEIPSQLNFSSPHRLIEIIPDASSTERFWNKLAQL